MDNERVAYDRGLYVANLRLQRASRETLDLFEKTLDRLTNFGFSIKRVTPVWVIVSHANSQHTVQLEIDGSNLDSALILEDDLIEFFPRGGGWRAKSTTILVEDNIDFGVERIRAYFNQHEDKEDYNNSNLVENVKSEYLYNQILKDNLAK